MSQINASLEQAVRHQIQLVSFPGRVNHCDALYLAELELGKRQWLLAASNELPALTISDFFGFLEAGGMIEPRRLSENREPPRWLTLLVIYFYLQFIIELIGEILMPNPNLVYTLRWSFVQDSRSTIQGRRKEEGTKATSKKARDGAGVSRQHTQCIHEFLKIICGAWESAVPVST